METSTGELKELLNVLVEVRRNAGLRQIDVAQALKISQPAVSEFESGNNVPRIDTLQKYAQAVGANVYFTVEAPDSITQENGQPA